MAATPPTGPPSLRMLKIDDEFTLVPPKAKVKDAASMLKSDSDLTILAYEGAGKPGMIAKLRGKTEGILGVITTEILVKASAEDKKLDGGDPIKQCWSENILELHIDTPIIKALQEIHQKQPDAVIIRESDGSFQGFLSAGDFRGAMELLGEPNLGGDGKPTKAPAPEEDDGGILDAVGDVIHGAVDMATDLIEDVAGMLTKTVEAAGMVNPQAKAAAKAAKGAKKVIHGVGDTLQDIVFRDGGEDDTMVKRIARLNLIHPNENYMRVADMLCKNLEGTILVFKHTKGAKVNPLKEGLASIKDFHGALNLDSLLEMLADGKAVASVKAKEEKYLKGPLLNMSNISSVAHTLDTAKTVDFAAMLVTDHHDKVHGFLGKYDLKDRTVDESAKPTIKPSPPAAKVPEEAQGKVSEGASTGIKKVDVGEVMRRWQSLDEDQKLALRHLVNNDGATFSALNTILGEEVWESLPNLAPPENIPLAFSLSEAIDDDRFNPENTQKLVGIAQGLGLGEDSTVPELLAAAQAQAMADGVLDDAEKAKIAEIHGIVNDIKQSMIDKAMERIPGPEQEVDA